VGQIFAIGQLLPFSGNSRLGLRLLNALKFMKESIMKRFAAFSLFLTLTPFALTANPLEPTEMMIDYDSDSLGWLSFTAGNPLNLVRVTINNQVTDNCWTSTEASKTAIELELKRSGYTVSKKTSKIYHSIVLSALGYAIDANRLCIITLGTSINTNVTETVSILGGHQLNNIRHQSIWNRRALLTGPKVSTNSKIRETFITHIQEALNNIDGIKRGVLSQVNQTQNVNFKEPREVWPSDRKVTGVKLEELRVLWGKYFNSFFVKPR